MKKQKRTYKNKDAIVRQNERTRKARRRTVWIVLIFGILAIIISYYLYQTYTLKEKEKTNIIELIALKKEKLALEKELKNINKDEYIEMEARERLRMIRDGEILYLFKDE
jgi:cell division protein FtsB